MYANVVVTLMNVSHKRKNRFFTMTRRSLFFSRGGGGGGGRGQKRRALFLSAAQNDFYDFAAAFCCVPFDVLGVNIFFAAERSFLPTLFVAGLFLSLVLVFFLLDLRDGVSVEGVFAGDDASASFAGDGVVFVFFFWEDALVGDGRFLELDSDGLCCFNGVVFRESNARDGDVGMVRRRT